MFPRLLSILAVAFLTCCVLEPTAQAQTPAAYALTADRVQALARQLSDRAILEVQGLEFSAYRGDAGTLVAEGDSWFDYPFYDVLQNLEGVYQYRVESTAHKGDTLESMVYDQDQLSGLALKMSRLAAIKVQPIAILLSGGGNDIAGPELAVLLNHAQSGLPTLNESVVSGVIDVRLRASYHTFIQAVTNLSKEYFGRTIPVLIHGYDYPVPDGRGILGGWGFLPGPWLKPYFEQKGYNSIPENLATLRTLVTRFNAVLETIPKEPGYGHVCYVRVAGTLSSALTEPRRYDRDWGNELHPTRSGFRQVAAKFQEALTSCARPR